MNIVSNQIDDLNVKLTIDIAAADYAAAEKKRLNERKRNADFKGFRKGMAPISLIQRVYGEQCLLEAVNQVLSDALNNYINENKLRVIGEPLTSEDQAEIEWKSGNDFEFKFDIASTPEINVEVSAEDKLPYYDINVTETAKKEMKNNILRQFGKLEEGDKAGEEDFVIADLSQEGKTVEGAYIAVRNVEGEAHNLFVGAKAGDVFDIDVNSAFSNESDRAAMIKVKKDELAGINPIFKVAVVNVKTFVPAEANQETFDKAFGPDKVHSEEEFDAAVADNIKNNYKQEADAQLSKDLRAYLVDKANISLPEAFLKRWLLHVNEGKYTAEDIDKEFDGFLADYRWQLVRGNYMQKNNLKVEDKDMMEAAQAFAAYQYAMYGMGNAPEDMIKEYAVRVLQDERQARQIEESVEDNKVISSIKDIITLQHKKISVDKFRSLK